MFAGDSNNNCAAVLYSKKEGPTKLKTRDEDLDGAAAAAAAVRLLSVTR